MKPTETTERVGAGADGKGLWTLPALLAHVARTSDYELTWAEGYANGWETPKGGVWLWGHYSNNDQEWWDRLYRLADSYAYMQRYGHENDDQDQTRTCDQCYKVIVTCARGETFDFHVGDGAITCGTCIREGLPAILEDELSDGEGLGITEGDNGWYLEERETFRALRDMEKDHGWKIEVFGQIYADDPESRQEWDYRTPCPTCNHELWGSMRAAAMAGVAWHRDGKKHEIPEGKPGCEKCEGKGFEGRIHVNYRSRAYEAHEVPFPEASGTRSAYSHHEAAWEDRRQELKANGIPHVWGRLGFCWIAMPEEYCALGEHPKPSPRAVRLAERLVEQGILSVSLEDLEDACWVQSKKFESWLMAEAKEAAKTSPVAEQCILRGIPVTPGYVQTALNRGLDVSWLLRPE